MEIQRDKNFENAEESKRNMKQGEEFQHIYDWSPRRKREMIRFLKTNERY